MDQKDAIETLRELRVLSDEELELRYDKQAASVGRSVNHYLREIVRRDQDKQTQAMLQYTREIRWLTRVIVVLTAVVVAATIVTMLVTINSMTS